MALQSDNRENSLGRWQAALDELRAEPPLAAGERSFALNVIVAVDTSGSMDGARLNAVKIGLCCLVSALGAADKVMLLHFDSAIRRLTATPTPAPTLLAALPGLLVGMRADGMTKYYDAVLECMQIAAQSFPQDGTPSAEADAPAVAPTATRTVVVTLTDGEDTASNADIEDVRVVLRSPGVDGLMFLAVTVDMAGGVLRALEPWFVYSHGKRIDVTVRTGRRLVGVFAETVLLRMLRDTEEAALSFYSIARRAVLREGCAEPAPATRRGRVYSDDGADVDAGMLLVAPVQHLAGGSVRAALDPTSFGDTGGDDGDDDAVAHTRCYSPIFARFDSCEED
jgi:hypothetical protein